MRWTEVKKSVVEGCLSLRSIVEMNYALQGKWLWRFGNDDGKLWRRMVEARWGNWERDGRRRGKYKPHRMSLWKKVSGGGSGFLECVGWHVGNGRGTHFWQDEWLGEGRLKERFPNIFSIAQEKDIMVENVEEYCNMLSCLTNIKLMENGDSRIWKLDK